MSKFFQTTLKKEKLLNLNRPKNDEKKTETAKKKNAKKFMISPVKEMKTNENIYTMMYQITI